MSSVLGRLFRHSAIYGGALIVSKSLVLVLLPIYSRELTPEEYGVYSLLLTSAAVVSGVMSLGFGTAVLRHAVVNKTRDPRDYYVSALTWHLLLVVCAAPLALLFADDISLALLGGRGHGDWVFLTITTAVLTTAALSPASYLRYRERARALSSLRIGQFALLGALNVFVLLVLDWGIRGLLLSEALVASLFLVATVAASRDGLSGRFTGATLRELLQYGLPLVPATLSMTALLAADRYFLNGLGYARELGLYSMAYRFGFLIFLLVSAIQTAWPPIMYAAADEQDAPRRFATMYTYFLAGFVGLGTSLALVSPPVVALLTPESYWGGTAVIPIVVLAYVLHSAYAIIGNAIYKSGRTVRVAIALLVATGVNIGLNALLIPDMGMMGAALATLAAYVVLVLMTGALAHGDFPVPYEWGRILRVAAAGGIAYTLCAALSGDLGTLRPWMLAAAGTILYPALLVALRVVGRDDLARLRGVLSTVRRRRISRTGATH